MISSLNKTDKTIHTIGHSLINIGSLVPSCPLGQPWRRSQRRRARTTHLWQRDRTTMRDSSDLAAASSLGPPSSRPVGRVWSESAQLENNVDFVYFFLIYKFIYFKSIITVYYQGHNEAKLSMTSSEVLHKNTVITLCFRTLKIISVQNRGCPKTLGNYGNTLLFLN